MVEHISSEQFNKEYPTYFKKPKGNKYNAKKLLLDGRVFDSTSEGDLYAELVLQKRAGLIKEIYCQWKEELWAYGKHIRDYYVDFKVEHNDGTIEFIEHKSKGTVTDIWQMKWSMLLAKYDKEISRGDVKCSVNWYKGYKIIKRGGVKK